MQWTASYSHDNDDDDIVAACKLILLCCWLIVVMLFCCETVGVANEQMTANCTQQCIILNLLQILSSVCQVGWVVCTKN